MVLVKIQKSEQLSFLHLINAEINISKRRCSKVTSNYSNKDSLKKSWGRAVQVGNKLQMERQKTEPVILRTTVISIMPESNL